MPMNNIPLCIYFVFTEHSISILHVNIRGCSIKNIIQCIETYDYIYICISVCVCVCVCFDMFTFQNVFPLSIYMEVRI